MSWTKLLNFTEGNEREVRKSIVSNGNKSFVGRSESLSNRTHVKKYKILADCYDLELSYGNFGVETTDSSGYGDFEIKATIHHKGVMYSVLFNGAETTTLMRGTIKNSDPISLHLFRGEEVEVRTFIYSNTISIYYNHVRGGTGEGGIAGDHTSGIISSSLSGSVYSPISLLAKIKDNLLPTFALIGSSSMEGWYDGTQRVGFGVRMMDERYPHINLGRAFGKTSDFLGTNRRYREQYIPYATHALVYYGSNDANAEHSFTTMRSNTLTLWQDLKNMGVKKIYHITIMPRVSNSDGVQTISNPPNEANKVAFNDWLRSNPSQLLDGVLDASDWAETERNSGYWKENLLPADGLHSGEEGHALLAQQLYQELVRVGL